jgi:hypothetical protein
MVCTRRSACYGSPWRNGMTHINDSNAIAMKCQSSSILVDPLQKNERQYKELSNTLGWSREIEIMLTSMNAQSALWDAAEFGE